MPTPLVCGEPHVMDVGDELVAETRGGRSQHMEGRFRDLGPDSISAEDGNPPGQTSHKWLSFSNSTPSSASACSALLSTLM